MKNYNNKQKGSIVIVGAVVILLVIAGVGYVMIHKSGSPESTMKVTDSPQNVFENPNASSPAKPAGNTAPVAQTKVQVEGKPSTALLAGYAQECNFAGVSNVKATTTGLPQGKTTTMTMNGAVLDALKASLCSKDIVTAYQLFLDSAGANTNGTWFTTRSYAGTDIKVNIKEITENGKKTLVLEQRTPLTAKDTVQVTQFKVLKDRFVYSSKIVFSIKGLDTLTDKSFDDLMKTSAVSGGATTYSYEE